MKLLTGLYLADRTARWHLRAKGMEMAQQRKVEAIENNNDFMGFAPGMGYIDQVNRTLLEIGDQDMEVLYESASQEVMASDLVYWVRDNQGNRLVVFNLNGVLYWAGSVKLQKRVSNAIHHHQQVTPIINLATVMHQMQQNAARQAAAARAARAALPWWKRIF